MEKLSNGLTELTVGEVTESLFTELDRLQRNYTNNTAKNIAKIDLVLQVLENIPETVNFSVEGVRGNERIRDFFMPNIGSVVECAIKWYYFHGDSVEKSLGEKDMQVGVVKWEIKASLSANSLATPSDDEVTYLVNRCGVFSIKKNEVREYINEQGRLPHNQPCGRRIGWLSKLCGFEG